MLKGLGSVQVFMILQLSSFSESRVLESRFKVFAAYTDRECVEEELSMSMQATSTLIESVWRRS